MGFEENGEVYPCSILRLRTNDSLSAVEAGRGASLSTRFVYLRDISYALQREKATVIGNSRIRKCTEYIVLFIPMSLSLCVTYETGGTLAVEPYDPARMIALVVLGVLLWKVIASQAEAFSAHARPFEVIAALIISIVQTLGRPIAEAGTLVFSTVSFGQNVQFVLSKGAFAALAAVTFLGNFVWIWVLIRLLYTWLEKSSGAIDWRGGSKQIKTPLILLILTICWLPYIVAWFPGAITSDQSNQLAQFFGFGGIPLTDRFPYLAGVVFSGLYKLGLLFDSSGICGIFFMTLLQMGIALFVCVTIIRWIQYLSRSRYVIVFSVVFFALFPLVPVYVVSIGKDGIHAFLLALYCLQIFLNLESRRRQLPASRLYSPWAIVATALLISFTRNNGIYLVMPPLVVMLLFTRSREFLIATASVLFLCAVWMRVLVPSFGVASFGSREVLSIPAQIVGANLAAGNGMDDGTKAVLEESYSASLDVVGARYVPEISDPSKGLLVVGEQGRTSTAEYCRAALVLVREHPFTSLVAICKTTMSMYPATYGTYWDEDCPYYCSPDDGYAAPGWCPSAMALTEKGGSAVNSVFRDLLHVIHRVFPLSILYTPGTYFILLVLLYGYVLAKGAGRLSVLCATLPLVMLEAVLFAAPCGSVRYALPLIFSLPFLLLLFETISSSKIESHYDASESEY